MSVSDFKGASAPFVVSGHVRYVANLLKSQRSPVYAAHYVVRNVDRHDRETLMRHLVPYVSPQSVKDLRDALEIIA